MANIPGNKTVNTSSELAAIDAPIGTEIWVIDDQQNWQCVPREPASGGIAGPSTSFRTWWAPADVASGRFGPFTSIAAFRAATPPSTWTEVTIEGVGSGIYKHDAGANMFDDDKWVIRPTAIASTANGAFFLRQSITPSVPRFVYGRDAAALLNEFKTGSISLFAVGDSLTVGLSTYASTNWTAVNVTGAQVGGQGLDTVFTRTTNPSPAGTNALYSMVHTAATVGRTQAHNLSNRIFYGGQTPQPLGCVGQICVLYGRYLKTATGVTAENIALQCYCNSQYTAAPQWSRSPMFSPRSATEEWAIAKCWIPAAAVWNNLIDVNWVFGNTPLVIGETFTHDLLTWYERGDGTGMTIHDLSIGGSRVDSMLDDSFYPAAALAPWMKARATKTPWLLLDLGANGYADYTSPDLLHYLNPGWHEGLLRKLIHKFRTAVGDHSAKVILRTDHPGSTTAANPYYQTAMRNMAATMSDVILVDTFEAAIELGGYGYAVAQGWMGDTIHYTATGRTAEEIRFNRIIQGLSLTP